MPKVTFRRLRGPLIAVTGTVAMAALLLWLMGFFHARVPPADPEPVQRTAAGERLVVAPERVETTETAVGTVRAVRETVVAPRLLGRIAKLNVQRAGQTVQEGEVLVELERAELEAATAEARAALAAAESKRDQARIDLTRSEELLQQGIAAPGRVDNDRTALRAAEAAVDQAKQALTGAETALAYAVVKAPFAGIVVDKLVQQGDIVQPGQPICSLYDPTRLMLVAVVREELAGRLAVGQEVAVALDALGKECHGTVAEIVPQATPQSRSFEVKVTGPCQPGIVTGMFGRLFVPTGARDLLRVPARAVQEVGQLDFVEVVGKDGHVDRRFVRLGARAGDRVEVLSGLGAGETILLRDGR
ncbi:MAG: efflux RND transporter periplasmic adaptor subunit [Planctomycetota bacterium]